MEHILVVPSPTSSDSSKDGQSLFRIIAFWFLLLKQLLFVPVQSCTYQEQWGHC